MSVTGYWVNGSTTNRTKVHLVANGQAICGLKTRTRTVWQIVCNGPSLDLVECKKCLAKHVPPPPVPKRPNHQAKVDAAALALRQAAIAWWDTPTGNDPQDLAGAKRHAKFLKAAIVYADAVRSQSAADRTSECGVPAVQRQGRTK